MAKTKISHPIDRHVGSRLRMRRVMLGMSHQQLGEAFGVTFQQVQKYEKGTNRMGASRLQEAARILDVPVPYFFEGAKTANFTGRTVALPRTPTSTSLPPARKGCGSLKHSRE